MPTCQQAIDTLSKNIGHTLPLNLLEEALTHRSVSASHNNERLELLGDAVLNLAITDVLLVQFPTANEGQLSRLRAALVREESLADVAATLQLGSFLILGEGEIKTGGRDRASLLADALEALIGAVYSDAGFLKAKVMITALFQARLASPDLIYQTIDYKTALQELLQAKRKPLPIYKLLKVTGLKHEQSFHVSCAVSSYHIIESGVGRTRRKAEQAAAQAVLQRFQR